ncbi:MAG: nucleotidyl transferase AbiEii/AbiGii toxin family protein [Pirellulaceae bacterium]
MLATLRHVAQLLNREGITWAIGGGIALSVWDHPRFTKDADFLIDVNGRDIAAILVAFQAAGLRPKRYPMLITVDGQRFAQFLYKPEDTDFDIQVDFIFAEQSYQRQALSRRLATEFSEWHVDAFVLSCEDLIIFKLVAGRIIDRADATALLRANGDRIDFSLLRRESRALKLSDDLARIWEEAFPNTNLPGSDA